MDNNAACGTLVAVEEVLHNAAFANLGRKEKAQKILFRHQIPISHMPTKNFKYHLNKSFTMQTMQTDTASYTYFMYLWQSQEFCTALHKC